ncbi:hypothetical protein ACFYO1_29600 [Nocardia sp. NPDC006044]|uniref:effector-associated constant component EACC1 n=1 Tax=Nocardia sp. NPDC006044 TaxID=3364306 RepID=UPI00368CE65A
MDVTLEFCDSTASGVSDDVRSLRQWLLSEPDLHGRVTLVAAAPDEGTLGSTVETLMVALGPGGVATAVASVLISWIRRRVTDINVKITRPDGSTCEVSASNVHDKHAESVRELTGWLTERERHRGDGVE